MKLSRNQKRIFLSVVTTTALALFLRCSPKEFQQSSFAPSNIKPVISGVTANGSDPLYCSISGGCSVNITGTDFYPGAKAYIGPYECINVTIPDAQHLSCKAGPGQNGVYQISIVNADGNVSQFASTVTDPTVLNFSYASFLYVGVQDSPGKVYGYAQNPRTGALLSIVGSPFSVSTENATYGTVISPNNHFLYSANVGTKTISAFNINAVTGSLSQIGTPIASGANGPNGLFFHPSGNFLYVTNQSGNSVSGFNVAADGSLTTIAGSPFSAGTASTLNGVVVDPSGSYLYAASMGGSGGVVGYSIDQTTGALTLLPGSPFSNTNGGFANTGDGITIHKNGQWLYMGLTGRKRVAAYSIDPTTGVLTGIGTPVLNNSTTGYTDNGGSGANISPDGLFFYGTAFSTTGSDPKKILTYSIDQTTGDLTLVSEADAGGGPNDIRVDINGQFAYSCNSLNSPSISAFSRDKTTGALSPLSPRDLSIPTANGGPGIMVIQR